MVIAIGDIFYGGPAKEVLTHYFEKHAIPYVFIESYPPDIKEVPVSWLKMICHRILPDYDAIVCWDLDLLPDSPDTVVINDFNMNMICLARDSLSLVQGHHNVVLPFCPEFKYNGGLICIPKMARLLTEMIFDNFAPGSLPWWEQCYLNNIIAETKVPIYELPRDINVFYNFEGFEKARLKHYTCGDNAKQTIQSHRDSYFGKLFKEDINSIKE